MVISPVLAWFLVGIGCFVIEMAVPGFVIFFLGIGAWFVALLLAMVDVSLTTQLIVFLVCSLITLVLLRTRLQTVFHGDASEQDDSVNIDSAPATGVVIETITPPGSGRVKYGGSYWKAVADEPIEVDAVVVIEKKKDLLIKVRALTAAKEEENG